MSSDIPPATPPASPAPATAIPVAPDDADPRFNAAPHRVSVMCPTGITPYAAEGLTLDKPLFARVTYRPD